MINFNELPDENMTMYIETINIESLKAFVQTALAQYGTVAKLKKANKVADVAWQRFENLGYIAEQAHQQFVDITIAAALLHNLFFVEDDIATILKHRTKLQDIVVECDLDERLAILVYELIEAQLGENHPVQKLKPSANSPASTLADAVWQVNTFKFRV